MGHRFSSFLKRKILGKNQNLISIDDPYATVERLFWANAIFVKKDYLNY